MSEPDIYWIIGFIVSTSIGIFIAFYFQHIQSKITKQAQDLDIKRYEELIVFTNTKN